MRRRLQTVSGKKAYAKRKETVEPVFGQIKEQRGFRRFLLRGLESVESRVAADLSDPQPLEMVSVEPDSIGSMRGGNALLPRNGLLLPTSTSPRKATSFAKVLRKE